MFKHTVKLALRSYWKNKSSFFINLIGLSTGLACVLLIYLWVSDELNIDKFNQQDEQLYQTLINYEFPNEIETWKGSPGVLAQALKEEMPEVELATTTNQKIFEPNGVLVHDAINLDITGRFTDEHFFDVFSYDLF